MAARSTTIATAALAILILAAPAFAADKVTTPSGTVHSRSVTPDGALRTISGDVSPFGRIDGALMILADPTTGTFSGQFAFCGKSGVVYGTIEGYFTSANTYAERLTFVAGTGKYFGVSGYADVAGTLDPTGGTGVDTVLGGRIRLR